MKRTYKLLISSFLTFAISPAYADNADLLSLYQKAENYDAEIFAAHSAYLAEQEGENLSFSGLLPSLNASTSLSRTNSNNPFSGDDSYKSRNFSVSLSQPLFNLPNWHTVSSSEQNTLRAQTIYLTAQQNLILNVASAYFNVLREQENLRSDRSQEAAVKRQYEQAKEQFDVGLIAITDVHEGKASYDASQTSRIRSEGNLTIAFENLSRITGDYATTLHTLNADFPIQLDSNTSVEQWVESATANNLDIKIASYALKALEKSLKAKKAQHLPTLDLNASYSDTKFGNYAPGSEHTESSDIALTLKIPLYSGGATQAGVKQTRHQVEQARHELTSAERQASIGTRTEYINLKTNIQTVESLQQNITSRESALEATREGYKVGTRNIVEVLDAERNYFTALRDYANARFDFVESSLRIKRVAGTLNLTDLEELNTWLSPNSK
jgi:outer membrane protein